MLSAVRFFVFLFCTSSIVSCYSPRYVYSPSTHNIPALEKKHDLIIAPSYSVGIGGKDAYASGYNHGLELNIAYAFSKRFAIMLNQHNRWEKNGGDNSFSPGDSSLLRYERNLTEVGIGYFKNVDDDSSVYFQFFTGAAFGKSSIFDEAFVQSGILKKHHRSNVVKAFIQPSFLFGHRRNFSAALSSRFSSIWFKDMVTNYNSSELDNYFLDSLAVSPVFMWEPAFNFEFGHKKLPGLRLQAQLGNSVLLNRRFIDYRSINFAVGVIADMRKLFARRKS
jgi:hypothetical protein